MGVSTMVPRASKITSSPLGDAWVLVYKNRRLPVNATAIRACPDMITGPHESFDHPEGTAPTSGIQALVRQFLLFYFFDQGALSKNVNYARLVMPEEYAAYGPRPSSVSFLFTKRCNFRCPHCYNDSGQTDSDELDADERQHLSHYLGRWGVRVVTLTGGEPLLHPQAVPFMETLASYGVLIKVSTNAWHVRESFLDLVRAGSVFQVNVSLDGATAATHDRYRGVAGSYRRTIQTLRKLDESGLPILNLNVAVYDGNLSQLGAICELAVKFCVKSIAFKPVLASGRENASSSALLSAEGLMSFRGIRDELHNDYGAQLNLSAPIVGGTIDAVQEDPIDCGGGQATMFIGSNGDMRPCELYPSSQPVPNVRNASPAVAWLQYPDFLDFRATVARARMLRSDRYSGCPAADAARKCAMPISVRLDQKNG